MDKTDKLRILSETHDDVDDVVTDVLVDGMYPGVYFALGAKLAHKLFGVVFIYRDEISLKHVAFNPYAYKKNGNIETANFLFLKKYKYIKIFFFR
jgi:hypothetical protein